MMAGVFLDVETTRDESKAKRAALQSALSTNAASICAELPGQLTAAGLTQQQSAALTGAVMHDREALDGLLLALHGSPDAPPSPWQQALWMLIADFAAAAVPILPFVFLPVARARIDFRGGDHRASGRARRRTRPDRGTRRCANDHGDGLRRHCRSASGRRHQRADRPHFHWICRLKTYSVFRQLLERSGRRSATWDSKNLDFAAF